jgi:A/G-specific adenine glycosylase
MKIDRKKAREELDVVSIVEWRRDVTSDETLFLLVRRPETGEL